MCFSAAGQFSPTQTKSLTELMLNKHSVHVDHSLDFGQALLHQKKTISVKIT